MYKNAIKARRKQQSAVNSKIKNAMSGLTPRTAALSFDLSRGESGHKIDQNRNAHIKALELVSNLLDGFGLPTHPRLEFHGMIKAATSKDGYIQDGIVRIAAVISTIMGHKANIDIPVVVRNKNLLEPAVFFYDGAPYVLCGPAINQLIKRGTLMKDSQHRQMFSAPVPTEVTREQLPRQPIINKDHMYNPGSRNPWKFRRYSEKHAQISDTDAARLSPYARQTCGQCGYDMPESEVACRNCGAPRRPAEPAIKTVQQPKKEDVFELEEGIPTLEVEGNKKTAHDGKPRKRTNIDTPTEVPELWEGPEDQMLDPAERASKDHDYAVGADVSVKEDVEVRERGGGTLIIPSGEKGEVIKDVYGDGLMADVWFEELCLHAVLPTRFLKSSQYEGPERRQHPESEEKSVEETFKDIKRKDEEATEVKSFWEKADEELRGKIKEQGATATKAAEVSQPPFPKTADDTRPVETALQEVLSKVPYPGTPASGYKLAGLTIAQMIEQAPQEAYKVISTSYPELVSQFLKMMKTKQNVPAKSASLFNNFYAFLKQADLTLEDLLKKPESEKKEEPASSKIPSSKSVGPGALKPLDRIVERVRSIFGDDEANSVKSVSMGLLGLKPISKEDLKQTIEEGIALSVQPELESLREDDPRRWEEFQTDLERAADEVVDNYVGSGEFSEYWGVDTDVDAGKIAATVEQVKHEVREMIREGYKPVDIRQTVQKKYPEHAEVALAGIE